MDPPPPRASPLLEQRPGTEPLRLTGPQQGGGGGRTRRSAARAEACFCSRAPYAGPCIAPPPAAVPGTSSRSSCLNTRRSFGMIVLPWVPTWFQGQRCVLASLGSS